MNVEAAYIIWPALVGLALIIGFIYACWGVIKHDEEFDNNWKFYIHFVVLVVTLIALVMNNFFREHFEALWIYWGF